MSCIAFKEVNFRRASLERIALCNKIIAEYLEAGLRLTLRQLYYQLVSRNVVPNTEKSYKNLGNLISEARWAGLVDWEAIEDRNRVPLQWAEYGSIQELVEEAQRTYRLPRWEGQANYVELWVEKSALAGVLEPLASKYHVTLMVNKGNSSTSAMYEGAQRFLERSDKAPVLFYLGDHDPSGEDMVRDIYERMVAFGVHDIRVEKLALTMAQVRHYKPPPNPVKFRADKRGEGHDSRAEKYIEEFGTSCWEVDALNPKILATIIERAFRGVTDMDRMNEVVRQEALERKHLKAALPALVKRIAKAVAADKSEPEEESEE